VKAPLDTRGRPLRRGQRVMLTGVVADVVHSTGWVAISLLPGRPGLAPLRLNPQDEALTIIADPTQEPPPPAAA